MKPKTTLKAVNIYDAITGEHFIVPIYPNKSEALKRSEEYSYIKDKYNKPEVESHLQVPIEIIVDSVEIISTSKAFERGLLGEFPPLNVPNGFVPIISFWEATDYDQLFEPGELFASEPKQETYNSMLLDQFIQQKCRKRAFPIFMDDWEAFVQLTKYQYGSEFWMPIQRKTIKIIDCTYFSVLELFKLHPQFKNKVVLPNAFKYTNVIRYVYLDENDKSEHIEILSLMLEKHHAERFSYNTQY